MTANQINYAKLQEDIRHNMATESETERHNLSDERIRSDTNAINMSNYEESVRHNVATEAINAEHYGRMDAETARNHLVQELETQRSNLAKEAETSRSNKASETIRAAELEEQTRHDKQVEKETKRHNKAEEKIGSAEAQASTSQAKTAAKNADTRYKEYQVSKYHAETQSKYWQGSLLVSQAELEEQQKYHGVTTKETKRHNEAVESQQWTATQNQFISTPSASVESSKTAAITEAEKAKATESLARAGYLKEQTDWYAWNQIVNTAADITQAVKNITSSIPIVGKLVSGK